MREIRFQGEGAVRFTRIKSLRYAKSKCGLAIGTRTQPDGLADFLFNGRYYQWRYLPQLNSKSAALAP